MRMCQIKILYIFLLNRPENLPFLLKIALASDSQKFNSKKGLFSETLVS